MADVVVVQPRIGEWDELRSKPNLSLSLLSACRLVARHFEVRLIDMRTDPDWRQSLKEALQDNPLCVGLTAFTGGQIHYALEASRIVKETSRSPVVWGGVHASLMPQITLSHPLVDVVIQGEGEVSFLEVVQALAAGKSLAGIPGVYVKQNGRISFGGPRAFCNLDDLPELPYELVKLEDYLPLFRGVPTINFETSRGCPLPLHLLLPDPIQQTHLQGLLARIHPEAHPPPGGEPRHPGPLRH